MATSEQEGAQEIVMDSIKRGREIGSVLFETVFLSVFNSLGSTAAETAKSAQQQHKAGF